MIPAWRNSDGRGIGATDSFQDELAGQPSPKQSPEDGAAGTHKNHISPRRRCRDKEDKERGLDSPQSRGNGGGHGATLGHIRIGRQETQATPTEGQGTPLADEPDNDRLNRNGQLAGQQNPRKSHEADGGGSDGWETEGQPPEAVPD